MARLLSTFKINNEQSHRHLDENGYLFVDESPVLKAGILEYYGQELIDGGSAEVDGIKIEPDKVYKVFIPVEELEKGVSSFALLPVTNDHQWLGIEGEDARDYQEGSTGENAVVKNEAIYVPLKFTGDGIIDDLNNHRKEELSASYTNKLSKSDNPEYDFIATDIKGNHIALVEKGRCGPDVRVLNNHMENMKMKTKNDKAKSKNEAMKLVIGDKEIDLNKFFSQEETEDAHAGTGSIVDTDNEDVDKRKQIDEIGGILKDKIDEELWRTVIKKVEDVAYNPSTASKTDNENPTDDDNDKTGMDNEDGGDDDDDKNKSENNAASFDRMYAKISNALKKQEADKAAGLKKAYNAASSIMGDFNPYGLTEREMLVKALNHQGVETDKESVAELYAMLKVCNSQAKVDNSFSYGSSGGEEIEINI